MSERSKAWVKAAVLSDERIGRFDRLLLGGDEAHPDAAVEPTGWAAVPWRTIVATVAIVVATVVALELVLLTTQVITWVVIAGFFAIVLAPAVRRVQAHVGGRRTAATGIVVFVTLASAIGMLAIFLVPVRTQLIAIITDLPGTIRDAGEGHGTVGKIVSKLHLNNYVKGHEASLRDAASKLSSSSFSIAKTVFAALFAFITITVIAFLFLSQAETLGKATTALIPIRHREAVRQAAVDAASAVSGYMIGNLLISLIAGATAFVCLFALGVPGAFVIALWVAFADLIPLVGATLGAAVGVLAAFLQGTTAGIIAVVFFVIYQQIENSVLYPAVMSRRVNVNPLGVLLSVLVAVEVFGFLGALLAVPFAGAMLVVMKAVRSQRITMNLIVPDPPSN